MNKSKLDLKENKYKIYARYIKFAIQLKKDKNLTCEICKEQKEKGNELVCHHIIPMKRIYDFEMIMDKANIMVLCHECHSYMHRMRGDPGNQGKKQAAFGIGSMKILKAIEGNFNKVVR